MAPRAKKIGRASRSFAQLWQVPTFFAGLTALVLVAATAPLRQDLTGPAFAADVAFLRNALANKSCDPGTETLAESLVARAGEFPDRLGEAHFLAGSVYQHLADAAADVQQIELRHKATLLLEKAGSLGVPASDTGILQFRLGRLLFETGGDLQRAAELLTRAAESGSVSRAVGYGLLTKTLVKLNNLDAALAANHKHLDTIENKRELDEALLLRGRLWLKKDNRLEALKALDRIGANAAEEIRIPARLLQAHCCEQETNWPRAASLWRELLSSPDKVPGGRDRILYSLGWALAKDTPSQATEAVTAWLEAAGSAGPEGQAALLRLGELTLRAAEPDTAAAIDYFAKALAKVPAAAEFHNPLIDLSAAQSIFENACQLLEENKDYLHLQELAEVYAKIARPGASETWLGHGLEGQALLLRERAANLTGEEAKLAETEANSAFQKAAETFEQAARVRGAGARSDVLWRSAVCYLAAKEIVGAAVVLDHFVQEEKSEPRLAEGWLALAETYSALGKKPDARQAYYKCIEFPTTQLAFRARYQLALVELESGNVDQAREILKQNLTSEGPPVDREAHERSLFTLAGVLYEQKDYDKACIYLKEAVEQYPKNSETIKARDQLGDCYRRFAKAADAKWKKKSTEPRHKRSRDGWLDLARSAYEKLADELSQKGAEQALSLSEAQILLRARIAVADVHRDLGNLGEALRIYQEIFQKHPRHPGRLAAFQGIWDCWNLFKNSEELARSSPELAQRTDELYRTSLELTFMDVQRMNDTDPPFKNEERMTRRYWITWLTWLRDSLPPRMNLVPGTSP